MLSTPVALIIFNRPELAARVFAEVAKARPKRLFIIADGPRTSRPGEAELCAATRKMVEQVDWDCEVTRDYAEVNQGAWRRIASGITSAFEQVEDLIVLEDDCIPHPTFFPFCEELLEKYRHDERVMHISGTHFQAQNQRDIPHSYSFARWPVSWGWATWRRGWQHFDLTLRRWNDLRHTSFLDDLIRDPRGAQQYRQFFDALYDQPNEWDGWDYAWTFACWSQNGLSILPSCTLVGNVGFGDDSTHFRSVPTDPRGRLVAQEMAFPLVHPRTMVEDRAADKFIIETYVVQPEPTPLGRAYMAAQRFLRTALSGKTLATGSSPAAPRS